VRVGILDLISKKPSKGLKAKVLKPGSASIMPQSVGVWAEQMGCEVQYSTYTGFEDLDDLLPTDVDILFVCAFTQAAYLAYSVSNIFRQQGVVTVLGGPHARSYATDARSYFDYVIGFADRDLIQDLLHDHPPHPGVGIQLSAAGQAEELPGVRERWRFIRHNLDKAPRWCRAVPMIGSLGCPYSCSFCVDSKIPYRPLPYAQLRDDLLFLRGQMKKPIIGWHDPNFGVRFDDFMTLIDDAGGPGAFRFVAECTISQLREERLEQLQRNNFVTLILGIESWFGFNDKVQQGRRSGMDKVAEVAEHIHLITRYIPYVQANFVFGLDADEGSQPFELTKRFLDLAPAAIPAYSLFTSFGDSAELDLQMQREGRVLDVPFHFLDAHSALNTRPKNYTYVELLEHMADLTRYSFLPRVAGRRFATNNHSLLSLPRWAQLIRSKGVLGRGRVDFYTRTRQRVMADPELQTFYAGQSRRLPAFFRNKIKTDLGHYYDHLPTGVLDYLEKDWPASGLN